MASGKGPWTPEEDRKLAEVIASHGAKKWKTIAAKAGLNRCGKSCRLRWLNYLRPNIKRGNISDQEEDLILRLHRLLGNRWSLIAGRLPGRTDNEIKNYWNSHLSKKINQKEKQTEVFKRQRSEDDEKGRAKKVRKVEDNNSNKSRSEDSSSSSLGADLIGMSSFNYSQSPTSTKKSSSSSFNVDDFFDFSNEDPLNLEWVNQFLQIDTAMS